MHSDEKSSCVILWEEGTMCEEGGGSPILLHLHAARHGEAAALLTTATTH